MAAVQTYTALTYCTMCGRNRDLQRHHKQPKRMGGRKGQAKVEIEKPENKEDICMVCHSAKHHIRAIMADGYNCDLCLERCEYAQLARKWK